LYGREICLSLKEENRLRIFENKELKRIFGLKIDEVTGGCRKSHTKKLRKQEGIF
jgi:hypothetical protein